MSARSITSCFDRWFWTMKLARSPTTLLEGVTFTMLPHSSFASSYAFFTSAHCPERPSCCDWYIRLVYWPPGISWKYTSDEPLFWPDSKGAYTPRTSFQ